MFDTLDGSSDGPRLEDVAVTTAVDSITYAPTGTSGDRFPPSTPRLFLCFRLRGASDTARLFISWHRVDEDEPLSVTNETVDNDARLAAEHVALQPFYPGPHYVRVDVDGREIRRVPFVIEGDVAVEAEARRRTTVSNVAFFASLDERGRPRGRPQRRFETGTRSVHCTFRVTGAPPGTRVSVRWTRDGSLQATTDLGTIGGDGDLSASLGGRSTLPPGRYFAEILLDDIARARGVLAIGTATDAPILSDLALTTAVDQRSRRPTAPPRSSFDGTERTLYLCLRYDAIPPASVVEVRWIQDSHPDEPMAVSTVGAVGSGRLAASFSPDSPLPAGSYRADVFFGGEVLDSVPFSVGR